MTVIYHRGRKPHPEGEKKNRSLLFVCGSRRPLSFSPDLVQMRGKSVVFVVCLLLEEKEGTAGRLSQAYPLIQQDILSPVLLLCFLRGWESSPFSAEGGQPSCTHCTHCACTERESRCLAEVRGEGGGFCTHAHARRRTHAWTRRPAP